MSYVSIGAVPGIPALRLSPAAQKRLKGASRGAQIDPRFVRGTASTSPFSAVPQIDLVRTIVNASVESRKFFTGVVKDWIDQDRGIEGMPGYERGYKSVGLFDGQRGKLGTTYKGRFWDFSQIYNKSTSSLDNMRAAAVILCFLRDPVHFVKVWGMRVGKSLLSPLGLGETAQAAPSAGVVDDPAEASQQEAVDLLAFFQEIMEAIQTAWNSFGPWVTSMFETNEPLVENVQSQVKREDAGAGDEAPEKGVPLIATLAAVGVVSYLLLKK